jgi:hypothetical protein
MHMHPIRNRNYLLLSRDAFCYLCSKDIMVYPESWIWYNDMLYHNRILWSICFQLGSADPFESAGAATNAWYGTCCAICWVAPRNAFSCVVDCGISQLLIGSRFSSLLRRGYICHEACALNYLVIVESCFLNTKFRFTGFGFSPALANVVINALYISNNFSSELAPTAILSTYNAIQKHIAF